MYNFCVFAGTTEGRELVEYLTTQPVSVTACVATEYGETLLPSGENLTVSARRLSGEEMTRLFRESRFQLVIDATHPYAQSVTDTIAAACGETNTPYLRLLRSASQRQQDAVYVPDSEGAAAYLSGTEGNILLTTGSKELGKFRGIPDFASRVYARVLPMQASLEACQTAGLPPAHILAVQGPFSEEMNLAMLHFTSAAWMVTKDGGDVGGFAGKVSAARKAGARLVVIGRPPQRDGISLEDTLRLLCAEYGCTHRSQVSIVGIGPGSREAMTLEVRQAIEAADCLIGAKRMLEAVAVPGQHTHTAIAAKDIGAYIAAHPEYRRIGVVMSGDVGFFSGTKKLLPLLDGCEVTVLPGLSSLAYLCARLKTSYEDVFVTSLHGRQHDIVPDVRAHSRVFVLTGGLDGVANLCRSLRDAGLGRVKVSIGQRLSYPEETITRGTAQELAEGSYAPLSAALIENDQPDAVITHGLPDAVFQRGPGPEGVVPMTKSEVRSVCLSKLRLTEGAVCWDVGAGTGSVAIEMALQAKKGQVFAIERKEAALELLHRNKAGLSAENLTVVPGTAPEACRDLPAPSHVFIGGSSDNLRQILSLVLQKNPKARIVATAISLETVSELTACLREFPFSETEVVSMQIARDRKAGSYHLMVGQNPIYIFTMQG